MELISALALCTLQGVLLCRLCSTGIYIDAVPCKPWRCDAAAIECRLALRAELVTRCENRGDAYEQACRRLLRLKTIG